MHLEELLLQEYTASRTQFSQILNDSTVKMGFECEMLADGDGDDDGYDDDDDDDDESWYESDEYQEYQSALSDYENWEGEDEPEFNDMTYAQVMDTEGVSIGERDKRNLATLFREWKDERIRNEWNEVSSSYIPKYLASHPGRDRTDAYHSWRADRHERLPNPDNDNDAEERDDDINAYIRATYGSMKDFMDEMGIEWEDPNPRPEEPDEPERPSRNNRYGGGYGGRDSGMSHSQIARSLENELGVRAVTGRTSDLNTWRVIPDGSLPGNGAEVVSGVYPLKEGLAKLKAMFQWMSNNGMETTDATGLHVSFSIDGIRDDDEYDFLKMMIFFDENYTASIFDRMDNTYASQMRNVLFRDIQHNDPATVMASRHIGSVIAALKHMGKGLPSQLGSEKYYSFRHRAKGVVEFRNMGGRDYHDQFDVIRQRIVNMAYVMKLGSDDKLMQRDYLTRIYAMLTGDKFKDPSLTKKYAPTVAPPAGLSAFKDLIAKTPVLAQLTGNVPQLLKRIAGLIPAASLSRFQLGQFRIAMAQNKISPDMLRMSLHNDTIYNQLAAKMRWPIAVPGEHPDEQEPLPFARRGGQYPDTRPSPNQNPAYPDTEGNPTDPRRDAYGSYPHLPGLQSTTRRRT